VHISFDIMELKTKPPETIFVLIRVKAGKVASVADALETIKNVDEVAMVTGRYDIVAVVRGTQLNRMLATVVAKIQNVEGIGSTETLVGMPKYADMMNLFGVTKIQ